MTNEATEPKILRMTGTIVQGGTAANLFLFRGWAQETQLLMHVRSLLVGTC